MQPKMTKFKRPEFLQNYFFLIKTNMHIFTMSTSSLQCLKKQPMKIGGRMFYSEISTKTNIVPYNAVKDHELKFK